MYTEIGEALVLCEVNQRLPLVKDSVSLQLTSRATGKVECSDGRLLELNPHAGPLIEVGHHTQEKLDTTRRGSDMSAAGLVTKVRSSAKPRLGVSRPAMVL